MRAQTIATGFLLLLAGRCAAVDGSYDPAFGDGGRLFTPLVLDTAFSQPRLHALADGKLLVAATCIVPTFSGEADDFCIARLNADGRAYDSAFGHGGALALHEFAGFPGGVTLQDMLVLADGRIALLGFDPNTFGILVAVLRADGSALDPAVNAGQGWFEFQFGGDGGYGERLAQQRDGKLLVAGEEFVGGNEDLAVVRFSVDLTAFDAGFGDAGVQRIGFDLGGASGNNADALGAIAIQDDGAIMLAGTAYSAYTTTPSIAVASAVAFARLTPDGQPDAAFGPNADGRLFLSIGDVAAATALDIDRRGRIAYGGFVANSDLTGHQWLLGRLLPDGTPDAAFNGGVPRVFLPLPGVTPGQQLVRAIARQRDGKLLAAGVATRDGDIDAKQRWWGVVRFTTDGAFDAGFGNAGRDYGSFTAASAGCCGYSDEASAIALAGSGIVLAGSGTISVGGARRLGVARLRVDDIFADAFEDTL